MNWGQGLACVGYAGLVLLTLITMALWLALFDGLEDEWQGLALLVCTALTVFFWGAL